MASHFERKHRILKTDEFSSVFRLRPVLRTEHLVVYACPNALSHVRLGVVAGKRFAARAVTRNAIKRAVREGFRQSELMKAVGLDCVVRLAKPIVSKHQPACSTALQAELYREVQRLLELLLQLLLQRLPQHLSAISTQLQQPLLDRTK